MRWLNYFIIVFLFFSGGACSSAENKADSSISQALTEIASKQSTVDSYTVDMEVYENNALVFIGTNKYKKPNLFRREGKLVEEEATVVVISDGTYKWTYYPFASMVIKEMAPPSSKEFLLTLGIVDVELKNYTEKLEDGTTVSYQIDFAGKEKIDETMCYVFDTEKNIEISKNEVYHFYARLFINEQTGQVHKISSGKSEKDTFEIIFKEYAPQKIEDSVFQFNIPDGAIVNDLTATKSTTSEIKGRFDFLP